jgi:hypothetical protein
MFAHADLRKLNTEPSIHVDVSYQVSVHMDKQFQRRRFFLEIDQSETRIACGLSKECTFCYDPLANMAATGNSSF